MDLWKSCWRSVSFSLSIRTWWLYTRVTVPTTLASGDSQVFCTSSSRMRSRNASERLVYPRLLIKRSNFSNSSESMATPIRLRPLIRTEIIEDGGARVSGAGREAEVAAFGRWHDFNDRATLEINSDAHPGRIPVNAGLGHAGPGCGARGGLFRAACARPGTIQSAAIGRHGRLCVCRADDQLSGGRRD